MDNLVSVRVMADAFGLVNLTKDIDLSQVMLGLPSVNRPGLLLAGFMDYFEPERLQIIGIVEYTFLEGMSDFARREALRTLITSGITCLVLCRGLQPFPEMLEFAAVAEKPVAILSCGEATSDFIGEVLRWLKVKMAPCITKHGVLVDVYGEGLLIIGESGIGKSEMALELIKRGHRLVADDAVEIRKVSSQTLIGSCPEVIRFLIELRGIGIVDIAKMFGVQAIKETQTIDLVIKLEMWDDSREYDRLGLTDEYIEILGNRVVCQTIPIRPGRNLAMIGESAAVNHRQKKMGYWAARELSERLSLKYDNNK